MFFFSSRRRHTRCALVTGVQTCALPICLRAWVEAQTHHPIGYVEQLYTFADGDRANWQGQRIISVSYLGLTRESENLDIDSVGWQDWYRYFPWEDWRLGRPQMLIDKILPDRKSVV